MTAAGTGEEEEQLGSCCNLPVPQGPFCKKGMYCATALFYTIHSFLAKKTMNSKRARVHDTFDLYISKKENQTGAMIISEQWWLGF